MLILLIFSIIIGCVVGALTYDFIGLIVGVWVFCINISEALKWSMFDSRIDRIIHNSNRNADRIEKAIRDNSSEEWNPFKGKSYDIRHYDNRQIHIYNAEGKTKSTKKGNLSLSQKNPTAKNKTK
jgi:hypothetical protein